MFEIREYWESGTVVSQAKQIATRCTNRRPDNVITEVLNRIQAKNISGNLSSVYKSAKSQVDAHGSKTCPFQGTKICTEFIASRPHSWQAHLKRISRFLLKVKVWWDSTDDEFFLWQWAWKRQTRRSHNVPFSIIFLAWNRNSICRNLESYYWKENRIALFVFKNFWWWRKFVIYSVYSWSNKYNFNACDEDHFDNSSGISSTLLNVLTTPSNCTGNVVSDSPPQSNLLATSTPLSSVTSLQEKRNVTTPIRNVNAKHKRPVTTSCTNDASNMVAGPDDNYEIASESNGTCSVSHSLVSKNANAIAYIIGFSPELAKFDKLHVKCKSSALVSRADRDVYKNVFFLFYKQRFCSRETF